MMIRTADGDVVRADSERGRRELRARAAERRWYRRMQPGRTRIVERGERQPKPRGWQRRDREQRRAQAGSQGTPKAEREPVEDAPVECESSHVPQIRYHRRVRCVSYLALDGTTGWQARAVNCRRGPCGTDGHPAHGGTLLALRKQIDKAIR